MCCLSFSPSGEQLAVGGEDKKVSLLSTSSWDVLQDVQRESIVVYTGFSPSGEYLTVCGENKTVDVLSTSTWEISHEATRNGRVDSLCFSPSGEYLALGGEDNTVAILSTSTWQVIREVRRNGRVKSVCFSPSGDQLAVGGEDRKVAVLSTSTWEIVQEMERKGWVHSLCFSPSGEYLAVGGRDKKVIYIKLGPKLSAELVPMDMVEQVMADGSSTSLIPSYCFEYSPGPTLIERCITKGTPIESILNLVSRYPKLLCAKDKNNSAYKLFEDAVMENGQSGTIKTALTTLFSSEVFSQLMFTRTSTCFENHFERIISTYPNVWSAVLKETCLVSWRCLTTHASKAKGLEQQLPSESSFHCPWNRDLHVPGGDILVTVFPIPGLFSLKILRLMTTQCDMSSVDNDAMGYVLKILWGHYIMMYFYAELVLYSVCVACWARFLEEERRIGFSTLQIACMLVMGLIVILLILKELFAAIRSAAPTTTNGAENEVPTNEKEHEVHHLERSNGNVTLAPTPAARNVMMSALIHHFSDGWNIVDALALGLTMTCLTIACVPSYGGRGVFILHVVNSALLTVKFLAYLRGFESTGWLITVLLQNVRDMRGFMIILFVILAGFTVIFRTLFDKVEGNCDVIFSDPDDDNADFALTSACQRGPFEQFALVAFGVFNMGIMGDFDTDNFDNSVSPWTSRVCFILLVVVVTVIALNALIALLGDSYSQIQENMVANRNFERAKVIVEYLSLLPKEHLDRIEKGVRFLFVLIPKYDLDDDGHINRKDNEWEGSINATKKLFETKFRLSEIQLEYLKSDLKSLSTEMTHLNTEIADLKSDLKCVLSLLTTGSHQTSQPQPQPQGPSTTTTTTIRRRIRRKPRRREEDP